MVHSKSIRTEFQAYLIFFVAYLFFYVGNELFFLQFDPRGMEPPYWWDVLPAWWKTFLYWVNLLSNALLIFVFFRYNTKIAHENAVKLPLLLMCISILVFFIYGQLYGMVVESLVDVKTKTAKEAMWIQTLRFMPATIIGIVLNIFLWVRSLKVTDRFFKKYLLIYVVLFWVIWGLSICIPVVFSYMKNNEPTRTLGSMFLTNIIGLAPKVLILVFIMKVLKGRKSFVTN